MRPDHVTPEQWQDAFVGDTLFLAEKYGAASVRPLVFRDHDLALTMAGRAGSTFAVKWFVHHHDIVEEFNWPHRVRMEQLLPAEWHRKRVRSIVDADAPVPHVVRVARNPFRRCVSAFVHSLRQLRPRRPVAAHLGREPEEAYSFIEYLDAMATLVPTGGCDEHGSLQTSLIESLVGTGSVHRIEDGIEGLRALEAELGLRPTTDEAYAALRGGSTHATTYVDDAPSAAAGPVDEMAFTPGRDVARTIPRATHFLTPRAIERIAAIYAADFDHLGYAPELERER